MNEMWVFVKIFFKLEYNVKIKNLIQLFNSNSRLLIINCIINNRIINFSLYTIIPYIIYSIFYFSLKFQ